MDQPHTPPRPIPRGLPAGSAVALLLLVLLLSVVAWLAWQFAQLPAGVAAALRIALFTIPLLLLASAGAVGLLTAYNRWGRLEIVKADKIVALTQASAQRFPAGLQSLNYHDSSKQLPALPASATDAPALPPPVPGVPTFGQLLDAGKIGPGQPLLLGVDATTGRPIEGGWESLYSVGIGALMGAGKSWVAAFLLAQSAAQGARLIVCDLHAGDKESLATRIAALSPAFMCDVASTPDAILAALKLADDKLQRRIAGQGARWQIIVAVDEWTSLLRTKIGTVLPEFVTNISEEGRKYNVVALLSAQGWTKDTAGVVRNRLTSHYVLRQRPDEARYQLGLPAGSLPLDVRLLPDATGYLLDVRGQLRKIVIPQMSSQDLVRVGAMIAQPAATTGQPFGFRMATSPLQPAVAVVANGTPAGSQMVASGNQATTAAGSAQTVSPEAARATALFVAGSSPAEIVRELRGIASSQGRAYQTALAEVLDLIRTGMRGV